ncbi:MAG: hypothetical protein Greene07147_579 [Parcubacteria group bacterium Greene0714_7]|nr:MAG: hypothetical protein Greene07147_579 [Parcubacteria group bacterium Greene0714_7]
MSEGPIRSDIQPRRATEVSKRMSLTDRALRIGLWIGGFAVGLMFSLGVAEGIHRLGEHLQQ